MVLGIVLLTLAALLLIGAGKDWLANRTQREVDDADRRSSHQRLMREIHRH